MRVTAPSRSTSVTGSAVPASLLHRLRPAGSAPWDHSPRVCCTSGCYQRLAVTHGDCRLAVRPSTGSARSDLAGLAQVDGLVAHADLGHDGAAAPAGQAVALVDLQLRRPAAGLAAQVEVAPVGQRDAAVLAASWMVSTSER